VARADGLAQPRDEFRLQRQLRASIHHSKPQGSANDGLQIS